MVKAYYTLNVPLRLVYAQPPKLRDALLWELQRYERWECHLKNDLPPLWPPSWRQTARRNMDDAASKVEALLQSITHT